MTNDQYAAIMIQLDSLDGRMKKIEDNCIIMRSVIQGDIEKLTPGIIEILRQHDSKFRVIFTMLTFVGTSLVSILLIIITAIFTDLWPKAIDSLFSML